MAHIGPVVLQVAGDQYLEGSRIAAIIWEGATASGYRVEIRGLGRNELLWAGRTNTTQTYLGAAIPPEGIHAPNGFYVPLLMAGRVLVYLRER